MRKISWNTGWLRFEKELLPWETDTHGKKVDLPDDCIIDQPRTPDAIGGARVGFFPDGYALYQKTFSAPPEWKGKNVFLHLDGAYMNTLITFNDTNVGIHPYGYTPFTVDLTPYLCFDIPNQLSISTHGTQPSSRWYSGTGIFREVTMWVGESCYLDPRDLFITTPVIEKARAVVHVEAEVTNSSVHTKQGKCSVQLLLGDQVKAQNAVPMILAPKEKTPCHVDLSLDTPKLWDDITPNLYRAVITITAEGQEADITELDIGLRKIEVNAANGLRVNGRKLKLYGGCIHHDNGMLGARAIPRAEERKIENLKVAGFNAHPHCSQPTFRGAVGCL